MCGTFILNAPLVITVSYYIMPEIKILGVNKALFNSRLGVYFVIQIIKQGRNVENVKNIIFYNTPCSNNYKNIGYVVGTPGL